MVHNHLSTYMVDTVMFLKNWKSIGREEYRESIHIQLSPKDAFGEYKQELVPIEDRNQFEDDLEVGQSVEMVFSEGEDEEIVLTYSVVEF